VRSAGNAFHRQIYVRLVCPSVRPCVRALPLGVHRLRGIRPPPQPLPPPTPAPGANEPVVKRISRPDRPYDDGPNQTHLFGVVSLNRKDYDGTHTSDNGREPPSPRHRFRPSLKTLQSFGVRVKRYRSSRFFVFRWSSSIVAQQESRSSCWRLQRSAWQCIRRGNVLLRCVCSAAREALGRPRGRRRGAGHFVSPRAQLVYLGSRAAAHNRQAFGRNVGRRTVVARSKCCRNEVASYNGNRQWFKQDQILKTKTKTTGSKQRHLADLTFK